MRARRIDWNHNEIAGALRALGCNVLSLAPLGNGAPDLLVQYRERLTMLEVKDGSKIPSQRKLTELEEKFHEEWGHWGNLHIVLGVEDAIRVCVRPPNHDSFISDEIRGTREPLIVPKSSVAFPGDR